MSRVDSVGLAKQTGAGAGGKGTANTTPSYYIPVTTASRGPNVEEMNAAETIGLPFPTDPERGVQWFGPAMRGMARAASFGRLLSGYMGDPVTSTPGGGTLSRLHVFDPVANHVPRAHSLLYTAADPDPAIVDLFVDAIGNELTMSVEPGTEGWVQFDASWVAAAIDETRPEPTVVADLTPRFPFYRCTVYLSVDGGAEAEIPVGRFGYSFNLNVATDQTVLGSRQLYDVPVGDRTAELTFTPKIDLADYYRRALALEPESIAMRCVAQGPVIEGSIRHELEIAVPRAFEITAPADIDGGESLRDIPVTARPAYDDASGEFVTVLLTNQVNAY